MAANVTEKDETLQEIIDWRKRLEDKYPWLSSVLPSRHEMDAYGVATGQANAHERGMDDDLTFQTVREPAGTAYMAGRSAPPTAVEIEAVAKRPCRLSQPPLWFPADPPAEQEKNLWRNTGTCDAQDEWLDKARDPLEIARKAASERARRSDTWECARRGEAAGAYYATCHHCGYRPAVHSQPPREKRTD